MKQLLNTVLAGSLALVSLGAFADTAADQAQASADQANAAAQQAQDNANTAQNNAATAQNNANAAQNAQADQAKPTTSGY